MPNGLWGLFCSILFCSGLFQIRKGWNMIQYIYVCVCVSVCVCVMSVQCYEWIEGKEVLNARDEEMKR